MSESDCGRVRELIPGLAAERLAGGDADDVARHVATCTECEAELALARMLVASRATVPAGLAGRVMDAVRHDRVVKAGRRPWWGISAAAVAALALGIGINSGPSESDVPLPDFASEFEEGDLWSSDDGLLAGAPTVDVLTDDVLLQLLEELDGSTGGAA